MPAVAKLSPPDIPGATQQTVTIESHDAGPFDVRFYEAGVGPPVLLLHGWPQDAWCWRSVIPLLADRYRLVAPDLRGFGQTDAPAGGSYNGLTIGADAVALLDALEIERAHLIGHDWGGFGAFAAAIAAPRRIASLVVLNTMPPWLELSPRLLWELRRSWYVLPLAAWGESIVRERPSLIARMLRGDRVQEGISRADAHGYAARLQRPDSARATMALYRSFVRSFRTVLVERSFEDLHLTVPTRIVFGAADMAISPVVLRGIERHCDDVAVELVPDSGHFIAEEKPELVADRAAALFERHPIDGFTNS
ncbi:MAG TPA: alpha/beta hydrolase [Thermoleophilaceae bacterium]|nr:alpha/beta hydrolase [Thermoleophilaceae bacterium]